MLRDRVSHNLHCSLLSGPLSAEDSTTYGVNSTCPLNEMNYFHVANSQIPQDVMHVLLEGVIPLETKLVIRSLMEDGYFTLDQLNERIANFSYGRAEARNKPPKQFQRLSFQSGSGSLHLSCEC